MTLIFSCDCKSNTNVVIQPIYKCQLLWNKSIISICLDSCINIFSFVSIIIPFIPHTNIFDVLDIFQNKIIIFMHWISHLWSVRNYIVMLIINFTLIYFISFLNILNFCLWNIWLSCKCQRTYQKIKITILLATCHWFINLSVHHLEMCYLYHIYPAEINPMVLWNASCPTWFTTIGRIQPLCVSLIEVPTLGNWNFIELAIIRKLSILSKVHMLFIYWKIEDTFSKYWPILKNNQ